LARDLSVSAVTAGFVTVLVGFASSAVIVFQAAGAVGATPAQVSSWMLALGVGMGLTCVLLSLRYRAPVVTAWSTPGAALLVTGAAGFTIANPRYVVSKFNDLRPQLLADATKNARATAQQFAADSGAQVGVIRSANQGSIQIFGMDGNDESGPFSPTSTPMKRIRVVSTFEFELR
jgi:hypothetical protein